MPHSHVTAWTQVGDVRQQLAQPIGVANAPDTSRLGLPDQMSGLHCPGDAAIKLDAAGVQLTGICEHGHRSWIAKRLPHHRWAGEFKLDQRGPPEEILLEALCGHWDEFSVEG